MLFRSNDTATTEIYTLSLHDALPISVFRRDELLEIPVTLGEPPADSVSIVPAEGATPAQAALREAWLAPFQR